MENPLVTVVIPCHNHAAYLWESIESVLNQTYKNLEIIIVDDESTDNTSQISSQYPVKYYYIKHEGSKTPANAHNFGFMKSNGEYLIFLGSDDKLHPSYVELCIRTFLTSQNNIGFVWTGCKEFESSQRIRIPNKRILRNEKEGYINPNGQLGAMMVPRTTYQKVGLYDISIGGLEDWDWIIRALRAGYIGVSLPDILHFARVHPQRVTSNVLQNNMINQLYSKYPKMKRANSIYRMKNRIKHPITTLKNLLLRLQGKSRETS